MTITPTAPSLYDLTYEQLAAQMAEWGEAGFRTCLLYTSDAADERSSVDLGGRRVLNKKTQRNQSDLGRSSEVAVPVEK